MGNYVYLQNKNFLGNEFEIQNGLLGAKRDILISLINLMIFRKDSLIRNLIGMSGESVCWINHFHFILARTLCERHLERHIIPSKRKRGKEITIKFRNVIFHLNRDVSRSVLINILIKNTILECTIKVNKDGNSCYCFYVGICTPRQVNDAVINCLGNKGCGGSFILDFWNIYVWCSGKYSRNLKEEGIREKEEKITAVVNNRNVNNKGGKMNIIKNQKRVPHTITNIPKDGVYLGFSCSSGSITLSVISLIHVSVLPPSFDDEIKCIAYNFNGRGGFEYNNLKYEEGEKVPNIIKVYYYNLSCQYDV